MKRFLTLLLAVLIVFSLTSCYFTYKTMKKQGEKDIYSPEAKDDKIITVTDDFNKPDIELQKGSIPEQASGQDGENVQAQENRQVATTDPREQALLLALDRAGVQRENAYDIEVEKDIDRGVEYWEVDFKSAGYEYEFEIKADNMEIVKFEKEIDD